MNINQKELFVPVKFGFIQLVSMEPEMIVSSTKIDHVAYIVITWSVARMKTIT